MDKKIKRNISIFVFVAIICGWFGVFIDMLIPDQPDGDTLGAGIWLVFPLIITIILRIFAGDGWKDMGIKPNFKGNIKWYVISVIIFPFVTAIVMAIGKIFGWIDFENFNINMFLSVFLSLFAIVFIKNIFEESVWRGYLTSKLSQLKLSDLWLYFIVGVVWGVWHLPYYLVFLSEVEITTFLPVSRLLFAFIAIVTMIGWTVLFVELYLITKSIWPVVLLHAVEDSFINPLIGDGFIEILKNKELLISPVFGIITTLLYLTIGLILRKKRKNIELLRV